MSNKSNKPRVSVVGSMNIDYVSSVEELPLRGETVHALDLNLLRGGKGANQAIAASRQGAEVSLFACAGDDEAGQSYVKALEKEGISSAHIQICSIPTGTAFITVDSRAENTIVISGGANDMLHVEDIERGREVIRNSGALLIQFEVPQSTRSCAAMIANQYEVPLIINPSPFDPTFPWLSLQTDYLIVNEGEAAEILEFKAALIESAEVRRRIHELRIGHLIITRGSKSTLVFPRTEDPFEVETMAVLPIDTVGAGDAFAGCFAAWIASGASLEESVHAANCAGALTTLGGGAQTPIPDRNKVEQHLSLSD